MFNNNSGGQQGPSKGIRLSFLTAQDQVKFEQIFSQSAAGSNKVSAQVVSDLLRRSNLDNESLAKIWDLASIANAPHLTFPEFAVAMFLTSKKLTGQQLPASLPPNVREETEMAMATIASTEPQQQQQLVNTSVPQQQFMMTGIQAQMTGMPPQMTGMQQPQMTGMPNNMMLHRPTPTPPRFQSPMQPMQTGFQPQQTSFQPSMPTGFQPSMPTGYATPPIQQAPKLRLQNLDFAKKMMPNQSGAVNLLNPSLGTSDANRISWKISPEDKQRYRDIFNAWEGSGSGFMSGDTAKDVLTQSQLAPQDLQKIWNLADAENRGSLDVDEFAIAMHLVYRKMNGFQVPATLPAELKPPSSLLKKFVLGRRPPPSAPKFVETPQEEEDTGSYNRYESDYVSTSRRKGPQSASSARYSNRYGEEEDVAILEDLRRQIAEQQRVLSRMPSPSRTAVSSASSKYSMEELKEKIRRAYEDVSSTTRSNPLAAQYLTHTETLAELLAEEKSLQDEIQYLCNRDIPVLARQLRGAAAELRDTKVRHSRQHDGTQDFMAFIQPTGPGGSITESDRVRAKAKAMMAARKTGSTTDAAYTLRRAEEEKQEADMKADAIEREMERSRTALLDMRGDLKYLEDIAAAKEIEDRKRFENGGSQELSFELRRFIEQLENKPVDTYASGARQMSSSGGYNTPNVASPLTTSTANVSSPKPKATPARPRTADEIKKEAERRVQERLAALQAKRGISSPRSVTNTPPPVSKPDEAEAAAQQRLRDAEREAQDSLRNREENDRHEAEQRRQRQEDQDRQRSEQERQREVDRQQEQERLEQERIEDAKRHEQEELEFQERKRQVLAKEEADRQARFDAIRREEEAEEAKKQQQHKPHEEVDTPVVEATPPPPPPPPAPVAAASEQSTSSNNPFAKLQQQGTSKAEKPNEAPTSAANKRVSYNPFATFSAFSATKKNETDSEEEEDDGWDVGHDSDDEFPAAGSAKNLAGMLFSAMSKRGLDTVPESPKQDHVPAPPPAPPVDSSAVPPPAVNAFVPLPPPAPAAPAVNNTFTPPAAPIGGGDMRNALLSQIQTGTKLKKTATNDRSASSVAGHVIGGTDAVQPAPAIEIAQLAPIAAPLSGGNFLAELQAKTAPSPPPVAAEPVHEAPEPVKELGPEHEYIALWDYPGSGADDLVFSQDDVVLIRDANETEDWWFGTLEKTKQTGYFPRNYVQPKPEDVPELNIKAKTLYDFEGPEGQGCLSFKMGDIVTVLVKENDDWWKAQFEGQVGLVPANYLEEI